MINEQKIAKDFPMVDNSLVYLDSSASSLKPKQVIKRMQLFYQKEYANIHRGAYPLSIFATKQYEAARACVAQFLGAQHNEIIFTKGTTESINLLAQTLPKAFPKKKTIILSQLEHHANIVPWLQTAKQHKLKIKYIPLKSDLTLDYKKAEKLVTKDTLIVAVNQISNAIGTINHIQQLTDLAHKNNTKIFVDAAQSVGHMPIDVKKLNVDFLAFSGHKALGPTGIGVLYGKEALLKKLPPYQTGGEMIKTVSYTNATFADIPNKFEAGTPPIAQALGLQAAIQYLQKVGIENIQTHTNELKEYAIKKLKTVPNIKLLLPPTDNHAPIISFTIKNIHPHDIAALLGEQKICIRSGHHCAEPLMNLLKLKGTCRISLYLYNTKKDIDITVQQLKKIQKMLGNRK